MKYITTIGDQKFVIDINREGEITLNGEVINADLRQTLDPTFYSIIMGNRSHDVRINPGEGSYTVQISGEAYEVVVQDERTARLAGVKSTLGGAAGEVVLKAPMPGVIVDVLVTEGQEVKRGEVVIVLESMKMQNEFKTPRDGKVHAVRVSKGDRVEQNAIMVTIT